MKLAKENSEQNVEKERRQLAELQAKRENSAAAFENDVAKYLTSGSIPKSKYLIIYVNILSHYCMITKTNSFS